MAQRSNPALSKPVNRKDEGAAHSIKARSFALQQRPYTLAQTKLLSLSFFACDTVADHTFLFARYTTDIIDNARRTGSWKQVRTYRLPQKVRRRSLNPAASSQNAACPVLAIKWICA